MKIEWFGHAFFLLSGEIDIAIDPFKDLNGYPNPKVKADVVLITHSHFDHNQPQVVEGEPEIIREYGSKEVKGVGIQGIKTFHDTEQGKKRGENTLFVIEMGGIRIAHCGDLGQILTDDQLKQIGQIDVLMIPVGGYYTIDAQGAWENVDKINPRIVIPMHYKQPFMDEKNPLVGVEGFLGDRKNIKRPESNTLELSKADLPAEQTIYVLNYK
ncbi:MAG: MBL fold metallo-hydrolase [candidate division Zixibacteria bacterium]|nr:MBL fold metallo-hydrolase [candidate division Zixibacteria bacterium]